ncbi:MAG TPA: hypothetical protein VEG39_08455 [Clostridia bacterium]|nr:hypothetical protein [Clostridia bacterium]
MQDYIRDHEVEQLLSLYHDLHGMAQSIKIQMSGLESSKATDDDIEAMALKHSTIDDIPGYSKGAASDRTAKVALSYEKSLNLETKKAMEELQWELQLVEAIIAKLEISLAVLSPVHKDIVMYRYCKDMRWGEIDSIINKSEYLFSISAMKSRCKEGVERITKVCRISITEFRSVMKLFYTEEKGDE